MTRWLVQFGYDGAGFHGWARQPDRRTVEGVILEGLPRRSVAGSASDAQLEVASRTDKGVHARANALALTSALPGAALLRALNGLSHEIFFSAAREVPMGFSVRTAACRWYRYFEPARGRDLQRWRDAAALFRGPVDVRSFGRDVPAAAPAWRAVERVEVARAGAVFVIDLRAPSFVWGMVRKMVASLREVDAGRLGSSDLREAIEGRRRLTLPLAEPERLVLWDVLYDADWTVRSRPGRGRYPVSAARAREAAAVRASILAALWPDTPATPSEPPRPRD